MESFSLLKYWKSTTRGGATTFPPENSAGEFDSGEDEGPFIDLEFALPEEEDCTFEEDGVEFAEIVDDDSEEEDDDENENENENVDSNVGEVSPLDEVLFNGQIVPISGDDEEEITSKFGQVKIPGSFLRSATKFRVLMLKLKRSKSNNSHTTQNQTPQKQSHNNNKDNNRRSSKLFTVKFKVEVPVISLLTRASSNSKPTTTTTTNTSSSETPSSNTNKKEVIQKYLKLVKPLYIRVSKRNQNSTTTATTTETTTTTTATTTTTCSVSSAFTGSGQKVSSVVGLNFKGMIMARRNNNLGKSKSAIVHSSSTDMQKNNGSSNKRRDDSLLELQDGIQGAILHCKRSFNSSSSTPDSENKDDSSMLTRSASDPSHEKKRTTITTATELTRVKEEKTTSS